MKIRSALIQSFGKFKHQSFDFADGLNVICGKNESGKSSFARFVRFMLYGYTSSRSSSLADNDKKRYTPWDEPKTLGEMTVVTADDTYVLRREQAARAAFSATDSSGTPVFNGQNAGEAILGVSADTFDKTAFIGSGDVFFGDADALSAAIKNMVFAADSTVDSDTALKRLEKLDTSILGKAGRSGRLFAARAELAEAKEAEVRLKDLHRDLLGAKASLGRVQTKLAENRETLARLEKEQQNRLAYEAFCLCQKVDEAKKAADQSRALFEDTRLAVNFGGFMPDRAFLAEMNRTLVELSGADQKVAFARDTLAEADKTYQASFRDIRQMKFNNTIDEAGINPSSLYDNITLLRKKHKTAKTLTLVFALLLVTFPIALFFAFRAKKIRTELEKLAARFGCQTLDELEGRLRAYAASAETASRAKGQKENAEKLLEAACAARAAVAQTLSDMLDKTGRGVSYSDSSALASAAAEHIRTLDAALARTENAERAFTKAASVYDGLCQSAGNLDLLRQKAAAYDQSLPLREAEKIERELDFYRRAIDGLLVQEREFEKKAAVLTGTMQKPDELAAHISALSAEIETLEKQHAALSLAISAIESAHDEMRGNVSPLLTKDASALFEKMTGGKYIGLYVDNELHLTFLEKGTAEYRDIAYLSAGALDAAYLALRLALAHFLYKEPPVFVFDDAFVHLDDERLDKVCEILKALAEQYQVIVLSCQTREAERLSSAGAKLLTL